MSLPIAGSWHSKTPSSPAAAHGEAGAEAEGTPAAAAGEATDAAAKAKARAAETGGSPTTRDEECFTVLVLLLRGKFMLAASCSHLLQKDNPPNSSTRANAMVQGSQCNYLFCVLAVTPAQSFHEVHII